MRKLLIAVLLIVIGCGKEAPLAPLRVDDPVVVEPIPLPRPAESRTWYYDPVIGKPVFGWRVKLGFTWENRDELRQGIIDATDHFLFEYRQSGWGDFQEIRAEKALDIL